MPIISAIAAMTHNRVIGINNTLPWRLPADLKHFRNLTTGHAIIMGRKNYESIGRPLPQRTNIIISSQPNYKAPGCIIVHGLQDALAAAKNADENEVFIIGGATIYKQFLPFIDRLYLTFVHRDIKGDTFFPELNWQAWKEVYREAHDADDKNPYPYTFVNYERITNKVAT